MNTSNQITEDQIGRLGAAYASICLERPAFVHRFTGWTGEKAARLLESSERLLSEFDESGESSLDDLVGVELSRCYKAVDDGDFDLAVECLYRLAAIAMRAIRYLTISRASCVGGGDAVDTPGQGGVSTDVFGV